MVLLEFNSVAVAFMITLKTTFNFNLDLYVISFTVLGSICNTIKELYSVQCTVYSVQCTVYSVQCTVYSVQCTVYSVQCTVYTVQTCLNIIFQMMKRLNILQIFVNPFKSRNKKLILKTNYNYRTLSIKCRICDAH